MWCFVVFVMEPCVLERVLLVQVEDCTSCSLPLPFSSLAFFTHFLPSDFSSNERKHRDAFKTHSTEIFILQMMIKNFVFYAFSTFINEYAATEGPGHMCRVFGIVTLCGFTTCVPMCECYFCAKVQNER
jgi:hypothetical protein